MSWWVWLIIIVVAWSFFGKKRNPSKKKAVGKKRTLSNNNVGSQADSKSAKDIASEITTIAHFRALEKKIERAEEKRAEGFADNARGENAAERADITAQTLQDAWDIASNITFRCQFLPDLDLETPLDTVKRAYKVFPVAEYEKKVREFGNENDWQELRADDEPEDKNDEVKFILKFRTIVENEELSSDEISKKINALVSRNTEQASEYFDIDSDIKPAEQWRIDYPKK